jgi:tetratricopeptide (TPR) repeat protein
MYYFFTGMSVNSIMSVTFPSNRPKIATDFNKLATIYYDIGQYSKALEFFNKAFDIH